MQQSQSLAHQGRGDRDGPNALAGIEGLIGDQGVKKASAKHKSRPKAAFVFLVVPAVQPLGRFNSSLIRFVLARSVTYSGTQATRTTAITSA